MGAEAVEAQRPSDVAGRLLAERLLTEIYRAVEPAYPEEGCGFVFETPEGELRVIPTLNRATRLHQMDPVAYPRDGRTYFEPDMKPWLQAARQGWVPRVIFHSHPDTGAYFSETDVAQAVFESEGQVHERNPGVIHLVVSVAPMGHDNARARVARVYAFSGQTFERVATFGPNGEALEE